MLPEQGVPDRSLRILPYAILSFQVVTNDFVHFSQLITSIIFEPFKPLNLCITSCAEHGHSCFMSCNFLPIVSSSLCSSVSYDQLLMSCIPTIRTYRYHA